MYKLVSVSSCIFNKSVSELWPHIKVSLFLLDFHCFPICLNFSDDLLSSSTYLYVLLREDFSYFFLSLSLYVRGCLECVCTAASFTAHAYSTGHLIHGPAASPAASIKNGYTDMTNLRWTKAQAVRIEQKDVAGKKRRDTNKRRASTLKCWFFLLLFVISFEYSIYNQSNHLDSSASVFGIIAHTLASLSTCTLKRRKNIWHGGWLVCYISFGATIHQRLFMSQMFSRKKFGAVDTSYGTLAAKYSDILTMCQSEAFNKTFTVLK